MAIFTPYQGTPNQPNYNTSKEIDVGKPDVSAGLALEGASKMFNLGINALDDINKSNIDKELRTQIDAERNVSIETGQELIGGPTAVETTVDRTQPTTEAVPPQIEQGLRRANMIAQANRQGKFDDVNYYGNMQTIFQGLISKYPGYTEYIHQKGASILGTNPANAQRSAIQSSLAQIQGSATKQYERDINDIEKWMPILGEDGVRMAMQAAGDPTKMANVRAHVAKIMNAKYKIDFETNDLELKIKKGSYVGGDAEKTLTTVWSQTAGSIMDNFMFRLNDGEISGTNLINKINERRLSGNPFTPDELGAIGAQASNLEAGYEQAWTRMISEPRFTDPVSGKPTNFSALVNNPTKLAQIKEQFMGPVKLMVRNIGSGRLDTSTAMAEWLKLQKDNNVAAVAQIPAIRVLQGVEGNLGTAAGPVIDTMYRLGNYKGIAELSTALNQMWQTSVSGGSPNPTNGPQAGLRAPQAQIEASRPNSPTVTPAENRMIIDSARFGVTQKEDKQIAMNWAQAIATGGTTEFINKMQPNQQVDVWANIASPDISTRIKELSREKPELWKNYRAWVEGNAMRLFGRDFADVQQSATFNQRLNIQWNENGRIDYSDPRSTSRLGPQRSTGQGFAPIDRVNTVLGVLREVYKLDGEKIDAKTLERFGLDLNRKYDTPWLDGLVKSVRKSINEAAEGSEGPRLFRDTPSRRTGGEVTTIPIGAQPNMGPPQQFEQDTLDPSFNRFDETFESVPPLGANDPLLAEGQRRLQQGFPQPR